MIIDPLAASISIPAIVLIAVMCYADEKSEAAKYAKFIEQRNLEGGSSIHDLIYDPPLTEREMRMVYREHSISEHLIQLPLFLGWTSVVFGMSLTSYFLMRSDASLAIGILCILIMLPCFAVFLRQTAKPCQCGALRVLSRQQRNILSRIYGAHSQPSLKSGLISVAQVSIVCIGFIAILLGCGTVLVPIFSSVYPAGCAAMAASTAVPTVLLAVLVFAASIVKPKKRFIPAVELELLLALQGNNARELQELIDFYSHIGNFARAEEYSRMLIVQAEHSFIEGNK